MTCACEIGHNINWSLHAPICWYSIMPLKYCNHILCSQFPSDFLNHGFSLHTFYYKIFAHTYRWCIDINLPCYSPTGAADILFWGLIITTLFIVATINFMIAAVCICNITYRYKMSKMGDLNNQKDTHIEKFNETSL